MASEYSVNISLDTTKAEGKLKNLKKGIDGLTSKKGGAAKKELSAEEQLLKIENQQLIVKNMLNNSKNISFIIIYFKLSIFSSIRSISVFNSLTSSCVVIIVCLTI